MQDFDLIQIQFSESAQDLLKYVLGFLTLGMALDLKLQDFWNLRRQLKAFSLGVFGQLLLFSALTYLLIVVLYAYEPLRLPYSMALGMLLVAACPGGNVSNLLTHQVNGNTALSVGLSGVSTLGAVLFTPLNFGFWTSLLPYAQGDLGSLQLSFWAVLQSVFILLGLPIVLGMALAHYFPKLAKKAQKPVKILSLLVFAVLIFGALFSNLNLFLKYIGSIAFIVALHNALALASGYGLGVLARLNRRDCRTLSIEIGIQNSGLGLILFFDFFPAQGYGGTALIAAWWGIWHLISGLILVAYWRSKSVNA